MSENMPEVIDVEPEWVDGDHDPVAEGDDLQFEEGNDDA